MNVKSILFVLLSACTTFACAGSASDESDTETAPVAADGERSENVETGVEPRAIYQERCRTDGDIRTCCFVDYQGNMICRVR